MEELLFSIEQYNRAIRRYDFIAARESFFILLELFEGKEDCFKETNYNKRNSRKIWANNESQKEDWTCCNKGCVGRFMSKETFSKIILTKEKLEKQADLEDVLKEKEISLTLSRKDFAPVVTAVGNYLEDNYLNEFAAKENLETLAISSITPKFGYAKKDFLSREELENN